MGVDKVNYNFNTLRMQPQQQQLPAKSNFLRKTPDVNQTSFTGVAVSTSEIKGVLAEIMPAVFRGMGRFKASIGEFQNIVINSIGTGLVAPIFIKYNPLSKTDEDTRTYSAWRQPVSAVLAILTQALITLPFDRVINNMVNNGEFGLKYNSTFAPNDKHIMKELRKNNPNLSKDELKILADTKIKKKKAEILNTLLDENKIKFSKKDAASLISMDKAELNALAIETISKELEHEKAELTKSYKIKTPLKIQRADFYRTNPVISKELLEELDQKLQTSSESQVKSYIKNKIKLLKKEKAEPELITMLEEVRDRRSYQNKKTGERVTLIDQMKKKVGGMLENHGIYSQMDSFETLQRKINEEAVERINALDGSITILKKAKAKFETDGNTTVKSVYEFIKKEVKARGLEKRFDEFILPKAMLSRLEHKIKSNVSALKQMSGLVVSFAMLPVTCSLLNWCYPRFMDAVFPNLSNKKHDTESSNLVERATKKAGVSA